MMVSSTEEGLPSRATEMATNRISTRLTRRSKLPVMQILEPPLMSGNVLPAGELVTEDIESPLRLQTRGVLDICVTQSWVDANRPLQLEVSR